ncbi:MAG: hypothetical protein ACJ0NN_01925 [Thermodesulfobacteriota bacterium]
MLALGESTSSILDSFYMKERIHCQDGKFTKDINFDLLHYQRASHDIKNSSGELILRENRRFSERIIDKLKSSKISNLDVTEDELLGSYLVRKIDGTYDPDNIVESNIVEEITEDTIELIKNNLIKDFRNIFC